MAELSISKVPVLPALSLMGVMALITDHCLTLLIKTHNVNQGIVHHDMLWANVYTIYLFFLPYQFIKRDISAGKTY
jgi:hypothetical protein